MVPSGMPRVEKEPLKNRSAWLRLATTGVAAFVRVALLGAALLLPTADQRRHRLRAKRAKWFRLLQWSFGMPSGINQAL